MARKKSSTDASMAELRAFGMTYPGAHKKAPWPGHDDLAVNDKTFAYLSPPGEPFSVGCKLPRTGSVALMLPFVEPMGYGLGKSGWVTAKVPSDQVGPNMSMFKAWVDESYRAQAPKTLVKQLDQPTKPATAGTRRPLAATRSRRSR